MKLDWGVGDNWRWVLMGPLTSSRLRVWVAVCILGKYWLTAFGEACNEAKVRKRTYMMTTSRAWYAFWWKT
ncbi:hypothetical protein PAXRUDRAFT_824741 [Paxillus rubicundulus Ve08.2h10]|uniref:Uncharacterized protein n=1 Tax=Paxillus rubicundulus Ve08.2h10 TaxID=930991 RepID=A0A0D0DHE9_9AGAM|nr:hypothetical protein PAXRUDRAFT_824741 [Paxillus rubicundulus Ve08.2h10]